MKESAHPFRPSREALGVVVLVLVLAIVAYLMRPKRAVAGGDLPPGSFYYQGPMKMKGGTTYGNEDGTPAAKPTTL